MRSVWRRPLYDAISVSVLERWNYFFDFVVPWDAALFVSVHFPPDAPP